MKWFKHLSGSLKDSIIFESIERFGGDGYLVFFGTLEMMADEFDIYQPDRVTLSMKKMTNLLQLSRQKTVRILSFFDEKAKKYSRENKSFFADINETHVTIICSRFASLADNHTAKELAKTTKLLGSDLEVTTSHRIKSIDNTDINKNKKSIGDKPPTTRFIPPTIEEVKAYCQERGKGVNPEKWFNHYTSNGWKVGKNKMVDWKAAVRTWEEDNPAGNNGNGARQKSDRQKAWEAERAEYGDNPELYPPHLMTAEEKQRYLVNPEYNRREL